MANVHTDLSSLFTAIADSIRTKRHTTESIVADNFPEEIDNIPDAEEAVRAYKNSILNASY